MTNEEPRDPDEIGALWKKTTQGGKEYLSGTVLGERVVVFVNYKKRHDKQPDYRVLKAKPPPQQ